MVVTNSIGAAEVSNSVSIPTIYFLQCCQCLPEAMLQIGEFWQRYKITYLGAGGRLIARMPQKYRLAILNEQM